MDMPPGTFCPSKDLNSMPVREVLMANAEPLTEAQPVQQDTAAQLLDGAD